MRRQQAAELFAALQAVVTMIAIVGAVAPVYHVKLEGRFARVGLLMGETDGYVSHGLRAMLSADDIRNTDTLNVLLVLVGSTGALARSLAISVWRRTRHGDRLSYLLHSVMVSAVVMHTVAAIAFFASLHAYFKEVDGSGAKVSLEAGFYFVVMAVFGAWVEVVVAHRLSQHRPYGSGVEGPMTISSTL